LVAGRDGDLHFSELGTTDSTAKLLRHSPVPEPAALPAAAAGKLVRFGGDAGCDRSGRPTDADGIGPAFGVFAACEAVRRTALALILGRRPGM
jgi:hypothetical protein